MEPCNFSSYDYNVFPVKVKNIHNPLEEIHQKTVELGDNQPYHYIVIEPTTAKEPLDISDLLPIFESNKVEEPEQIYGNYNAEINPDHSNVVRVSIACLKNSSSMKHIPFSTHIAMTDMLNKFANMEKETPYMYLPRIILNTKCNLLVAPTNTFSEMIREITLAFENQYHAYPTIFVTYHDVMTADNEECCKKKKKKNKKDKKKNKKKKGD